MKNTAICPKCGSEDIVSVPYREYIMFGVKPQRYICRRCGFSETWILQYDLETLRKSKRVRPVRRVKTEGDR